MKFFSLGGFGKDARPRSGERRRNGGDGYDGPERRSGADRRGLTYGLKFRTQGSLAALEEWLDARFPGDYRLTIEGMSDDLRTKEVRAVFAREDQRAALKFYLAGNK